MGYLPPYTQREVEIELEELARPVLASWLEEKVRELREDEEFFDEITERFEKGRREGDFPHLNKEYSHLSDKEEYSQFKYAVLKTCE